MKRRTLLRVAAASAAAVATNVTRDAIAADAPPAPAGSGPFELADATVAELSAAMHSGARTSRLDRAGLPRAHRRHRPARPGDQRDHRAQSRRARDRRRARPRAPREGRARPAARHPGAAQGQHRHGGPDAHHRRLARARRVDRAARRVRRRAPARGRLRDPRQDQPERVGELPRRALDQRLERARRPDAQSVRARSQHERLELGLGRGDRGQPRARSPSAPRPTARSSVRRRSAASSASSRRSGS